MRALLVLLLLVCFAPSVLAQFRPVAHRLDLAGADPRPFTPPAESSAHLSVRPVCPPPAEAGLGQAGSASSLLVHRQGRIVLDTLESRWLPSPRAISVYVPPARDSDTIAAVVYLGDGQLVRALAPVLDTLVMARRGPRILLVGIHADRSPGAPGSLSGRALEYVAGGRDSTRFLAHERFFLEEVLPWAESRFGAPKKRDCRIVLGFSNRANFAMQMGIRHPQQFGSVIAFSPAGNQPTLEAWPAQPWPAFFLLGGTREPEIHRGVVAWAAAFESRGIRHVVHAPAAGHEVRQWLKSLPEALEWALNPS